MADKILIVDDSETLRIQLRKLLEDGGFEVLEAENGSKGLALAQSRADIKLLISDYNMPEMDGVTMCRKIKEIPNYNSLTMLMLTTEASPELKALGKEAGIRAWIVKPFVGEKVIGAVRKVLGT